MCALAIPQVCVMAYRKFMFLIIRNFVLLYPAKDGNLLRVGFCIGKEHFFYDWRVGETERYMS